MGMLFKTSGEQEELKPAGQYLSLEEMQKAVGGYIELIRLNDKKALIINEDGKIMKLDFNLKATALAAHVLRHDDFIVGNAVLVEEAGDGEVR